MAATQHKCSTKYRSDSKFRLSSRMSIHSGQHSKRLGVLLSAVRIAAHAQSYEVQVTVCFNGSICSSLFS